VVAFADHCPHRLVPLSAGSVHSGRLRCAYHGWEFSADGRCVELPSLGPDAATPPRAHLDRAPDVREDAGTVWVRAAPGDDAPDEGLTNLDPALLHASWPVLEAEVRRIVGEGKAADGHIFNLGHGVLPGVDPDVLTRVVALVHEL
jgi:phenylpropionate dioxygenase-like ring-hydroxylating dioxygenase large terminal subunit